MLTRLTPWLVLWGAVAQATPIQLDHQARLVDASGVPLNGDVTLTIGIYTDGSTEAAEWSEAIPTVAANGYVAVILGGDVDNNPLQDTVFDGPARYIGVAVNSVPLGPRRLIATVPSAVHADRAPTGVVHISAG